MKLFLTSFLLIIAITLVACKTQKTGEKPMFFKGKEAALEQAINNDDGGAVKVAIKQGANVNVIGLHGVTPIIVTAGNLKFNAMKTLLESGANPNTYDKNGDNAVTLATTTYKKDKRYLELLMDNGGDPNSKRPNGDPLITRFGNDHNLDALRWLANKGADVNAISRTERPLIMYYAGSVDWDTVWVLMELGANYHFTNPLFLWKRELSDASETPPGSPLFEYKEKVWRKLCESGIEVPPLTSTEGWEKAFYAKDLPVPFDQMPIITCDNKTYKVIGKWGDLKPKVESALDYLKKKSEL